jgi:uncharacterized phiE125 gp8 family phage protein
VSLYVVTPPTSEPLTLAEARSHLRVDHAADDALIAGYIMAAREMAEHELQRSLVEKTYELALDAFPRGTIELPMGPIPAAAALTVSSVKYTDTAGAEQTVDPSAYTLDPYSNVPRLVPVSGWPTPKTTLNAVRVRYVSGAALSSVPPAVKSWMLLYITSLYEQREAVNVGNIVTPMPFVSRLLDPYRSFR